MSTCLHFEIAIEQRLADALGEEESTALDAHLATCETCRAYERSASGQQRLLGAHAEAAARDVDWARVEEGVKRGVRSRYLGLLIGLAIAAVIVPLSAWGFSSSGASPVHIFLITGAEVLAVILVRAITIARSVRRIAKLAKKEDLLEYHRTYLSQRARSIRRLRWVALIVFLWMACSAAFAALPAARLTYAGLAAVVGLAWAYVLLVRYPRVVRELAELGDEPRG